MAAKLDSLLNGAKDMILLFFVLILMRKLCLVIPAKATIPAGFPESVPIGLVDEPIGSIKTCLSTPVLIHMY